MDRICGQRCQRQLPLLLMACASIIFFEISDEFILCILFAPDVQIGHRACLLYLLNFSIENVIFRAGNVVI